MSSAYIFIGRSGSGKGVQTNYLTQALKEQNTDFHVIETGVLFREFMKTADSPAAEMVKERNDTGVRQPDFLAVKLWGDELLNVAPIPVLVFDGAPRSGLEAAILDTALTFYGVTNRRVFYLDVSGSEAERRLQKRGRPDDLTPAARIKRLNWFETDVIPALHFFQKTRTYRVYEINGERPAEDIFNDICSHIDFSIHLGTQ